ncbi:hypothetical protein SCARR_04671 [Pontiella sulfatireligans]|uniref:Uncharacterized protein n=1 Tax=Pontiella sulfatireligans TaxID=2750658 RepID=A0A6C2UUN7_9BACT|nr:hypothetical protein SCARR_04671 [Pontiella sulfatireligans]
MPQPITLVLLGIYILPIVLSSITFASGPFPRARFGQRGKRDACDTAPGLRRRHPAYSP